MHKVLEFIILFFYSACNHFLFEIVILEWMLHSKRESTQHASVSQGFTGAQNQIKRRENQKARARTVPPVSPNTRTVIGLSMELVATAAHFCI